MVVETKTVQKRAKRGERRELIIQSAHDVFAKNGFSASTRDIAAELGVTQALLYKYFPSKDALIDAVFDDRFTNGRYLPDPELLLDGPEPLAVRVARFYSAFYRFRQDGSLSLFIFGALAGYNSNAKYAPQLIHQSLMPLTQALRAEAGLPGFAERPMCNAEYELAMMQHGGISFMAIRHSIYKDESRIAVQEALEQHTRVYVAGALKEIRSIHENWARQTPMKPVSLPG